MYRVAKVVFPFPIEEEYDYLIPEELSSKVELGKRVMVSLKNREEEGIVVEIQKIDFLNPQIHYKEISQVFDEFPVVNQEQIELSYWVSKEYLCEVGEALDKMYPKPFKITKKDLLE